MDRKRIREVKDRMNEIWEQYDYNGSVEDLSEFEQLVIELYELENIYPLQNKEFFRCIDKAIDLIKKK